MAWAISIVHSGYSVANGVSDPIILESYTKIREHLDRFGGDRDTVTFPGNDTWHTIPLATFQVEVFGMEIEDSVDAYDKANRPVYKTPTSIWPGASTAATAPTTKILPEVRVDDEGAK